MKVRWIHVLSLAVALLAPVAVWAGSDAPSAGCESCPCCPCPLC